MARCSIAPAIVLCLFVDAVQAQENGTTETNPPTVIAPSFGDQLRTLTVPSPILTIDQDRLFAASAYGRRVQDELTRDRDALAAENRRIEAELTAEEREITAQRPDLVPADFADLAQAFDDKVQQIRSEQDSKSSQLQQRLEQERQTFIGVAGPVLAELVRRRGAVAVIDRQALLMVFEEIDITDEAIALIDERIGAGAPGALTDTAPATNDAETTAPEQ